MANFLFVLSKDNNESATRCMQFAKIAHSKGHQVDMFLIDGGVTWADKERDLSQKTDTGDCPTDYMDYLVLGNHLLAKDEQPEWRDMGDWREEFALD